MHRYLEIKVILIDSRIGGNNDETFNETTIDPWNALAQHFMVEVVEVQYNYNCNDL